MRINDDKKRISLAIIGVLTLLLTIIGATYAYFAADLGGGTNANINASTGTTDSLTFDAGDPIRIHATLENFAEGMESLKGSTTATATLKANNTTNQATGKYNIFFIIDDNDFVYSTEDGQAELVLKVTDPNGNEVEDITGLKKVETGFDITTRTGGFLVRADYEIETNGTTEQTWNIEVTLVNLDSDQNANMAKTLNGRFYITTEQLSTYELAEISSIESVTSYKSITANLNTLVGSSEIDKYYYAIEEDTSAVALLGFSNGILKTSSLAAKELNYIESDDPTHTFDNLKPNTSYKVYSYAKDIHGINSNVYETSITTEEYELPKVTGLTHISELYKITVTATSEAGSNEVSKYYFSKDNGVTWSEGQESATYVFDNLLDTTTYNIKVKVSDTEDKYSTEYYEAIATSTYINPSVTTVTNSKTYNSITLTATATKGTNEISKYYFSKDNGATWTARQTSNVYTYTGLSENTAYNIKVKVEDTLGRVSNSYSLNVTTNTYRVPSVTATTTKTSSSITVSATGTKGDGNIAKYMYSKDGGSNWTTQTSTSTTNSYTFSGLTSNTAYSIRVKVVDNNNRESSIYSVSVTTSYINPTVRITSTSKTSNSITVYYSGTAGSKSVSYYKVSCNSGSTYNNSYTTSYTCSGLSGSTTYGIRVIAVDAGGVQSSAATTSVTTNAVTLAAKVKSLYTSQGSNGIYYHSTSLGNSAGDNSYRYAGANPNNYVCFGSTDSFCPQENLYRIIGVFGDQVKLIKSDHATTAEIGTAAQSENDHFYWSGSSSNESNIWSNSTLNTSSLNGTYLTNLGTTWANKIATTTWYVGGVSYDNALRKDAKAAYDYEIGSGKSNVTYNAKIGLPYISEYYYAATPTFWGYRGCNFDTNISDGCYGCTTDYRAAYDSNWLALVDMWTISRSSSDTYNWEVFVAKRDGMTNIKNVADYYAGIYVRPTFNLLSTVKTSGGSGTQLDPYRIEL